jgi:radical SAM protein with 4Fe4S-binding SPASM domain
MSGYTSKKIVEILPRIPLEAHIDITYRCNNNCLHCWLWRPSNAPDHQDELTYNEIRDIVDQARAMGTRRWGISGGEPMLRPDFPDIFEYITTKAISYSLNTNGTLITPSIAKQLKRKGNKMIALYGATAETYDSVTRHPGGFEMAMRGFHYMQEADAGFTVQLIPLKANWHEWEQMKSLAESLSKNTRVGTSWLFMSSDKNSLRNNEILKQRLTPSDVIYLDKPRVKSETTKNGCSSDVEVNDCLFSACLRNRSEICIDSFGRMTFCQFIKDPTLLYDLRKGNVQDGWENFFPLLTDKVHGGKEWRNNCGSCEFRSNCKWCPAYSYLETGNYSSPIPYLCDIAHESVKFQENWIQTNRRYFQIADITIQVDSDKQFNDSTFVPAINKFQIVNPGDDVTLIDHHFTIPEFYEEALGIEKYRKIPWAIYQKENSWIYLSISDSASNRDLYKFARFTSDYSKADIYSINEDVFSRGNLSSLTTFPSDQVYIAQLLSDRKGCYLHSAGVILDGKGILFVGHSGAGKSTTIKMIINYIGDHNSNIENENEILCDDRNIIRRMNNGWRVYGSWSHGEIPIVSNASAPLSAIFFIEQAKENTIMPILNYPLIRNQLLSYVIKPFITNEWWQKTFTTIESLSKEIPFYEMRFDLSGDIINMIRKTIN